MKMAAEFKKIVEKSINAFVFLLTAAATAIGVVSTIILVGVLL